MYKLKKIILLSPFITPLNISILWNFGSLLGLCMIIQLISGLFLYMMNIK